MHSDSFLPKPPLLADAYRHRIATLGPEASQARNYCARTNECYYATILRSKGTGGCRQGSEGPRWPSAPPWRVILYGHVSRCDRQGDAGFAFGHRPQRADGLIGARP
jgi:hypothetical protein